MDSVESVDRDNISFDLLPVKNPDNNLLTAVVTVYSTHGVETVSFQHSELSTRANVNEKGRQAAGVSGSEFLKGEVVG